MKNTEVRGKIVIYLGDRYAEEQLTADEVITIIEKRSGLKFKRESDLVHTPSTLQGKIHLEAYGIEGKRNEPTIEDIKDFIKKQPDYRHSMNIITDHFFGKVLKVGDGNGNAKLYDRIWSRTEQARKQIAKTYGGEWKKISAGHGKGKPTTYTFEREWNI